MANLNNLAPHKEPNIPELLPCPACGAATISGWGMVGSVIYCSSDTCRLQLTAPEVHYWDLGELWNSIRRGDNVKSETPADD